MPQYIPIQFPPGVQSNGPEYASKGAWVDGNLVRWVNGWLRPVGGWAKFGRGTIVGSPRALITWLDNGAKKRVGIGTENNLYIHDGALPTDVTPAGLAAGNARGRVGYGYGAAGYGLSTYGTPREQSGTILGATVWDFAMFGEILVAVNPSDGRAFKWAPNTGGAADIVATPITNAPINNVGCSVTDERCVLLVGADGDPRRVQWSSVENMTDWTPTATNTAGSLQLATDGTLVNAAKLQGETLLLTTTDAHVLRFIGAPYMYGVQRVGTGCGLVAPHAHAEAAGFCAWMSSRGFFLYDGAVKPIPCSVWATIFDNLSTVQLSQVTAGVNSLFNEIWWFYPSQTALDNDRYAIWNYTDNWWSAGELSRSAWSDANALGTPIAADADGLLYQHEYGWMADGESRAQQGMVWLRSAPFDLGAGDRILHATQLLPDTNSLGTDSLSYQFDLRYTPNGDVHTTGPMTPTRPDGYVDARFSGRQAVLTVVATKDGPFQLGRLRLAVQQEGKR